MVKRQEYTRDGSPVNHRTPTTHTLAWRSNVSHHNVHVFGLWEDRMRLSECENARKMCTLMVSRASSITAHCLGLSALASSRTMCSWRPKRKPQINGHSTNSGHSFAWKERCQVPEHYGVKKTCCTFSLDSCPSSFAALKMS